jgi:glycosyltransferase involved in cell wall biosynthesis
MKIGIIIPTRNDRPGFLENCLRMLKAQTLQPEVIEVVDYIPVSDACDITDRYRTGYDRLRGLGLDAIAFIEDDDFYTSDYLETMAKYWIREGRPNLLGLDHTVYYNIRLFAHFTMYHSTRSSAMNSFIKPDMNFDWGVDENPYTDVHLWNLLRGKIVVPEKEICLGIKHGVGKCGGQSHTTHLSRYINKDEDRSFLKSIMDRESFEFYSNYFKV